MRSKGSGPVSGQLPLPGGTPRNLQHARREKENKKKRSESWGWAQENERGRKIGWLGSSSARSLSCHVLLTGAKTIWFSPKMRRAVVVEGAERVVERVGGGFQVEPSARKRNCRLYENNLCRCVINFLFATFTSCFKCLKVLDKKKEKEVVCIRVAFQAS